MQQQYQQTMLIWELQTFNYAVGPLFLRKVCDDLKSRRKETVENEDYYL